MSKKTRMNFSGRTAARTAAVIQGRLKMANLMEMSEAEFEEQLKELEKAPLFKLLKASGAVNLAEFPSARYAARNYAGYGLKLSGGDLPELADGNGDLVGLMQKMGAEKFEACFLKDAVMSDVERAEECDITVKDAVRLRDFVNSAYIQAEFEGAPEAPAARVFSAVAGIEIENGAPVLAFFNREVWKGRYKIDNDRLGMFTMELSEEERGRLEKLLRRMEFADQRKTTLYRALETLINIQADYLLSGEPGRRRPLSQRTVAKNLGVDPSVLNRLVSNKSVQMPWGTEVPMGVLLPSSKTVGRERLYQLACGNPEASDEVLAGEFEKSYGIKLSRRSIAQYRKELGLGAQGRRSAASE